MPSIKTFVQNIFGHGRPRKDPERIIDEFFKHVVQYYVAGRYAVFAALMPVAANLIHHAIEMLLKGALSKTMSAEKLRDKLRHRLWRIWKESKRLANDPALANYDRVIKELDKFESIRYPDELLKKGATISFEITKVGASQFKTIGVSEPQYKLCLEEIDEIVATVFRVASRNPKAFLHSLMREDARQYLFRDNRSFTP